MVFVAFASNSENKKRDFRFFYEFRVFFFEISFSILAFFILFW